jgi:hypothetical protein
MTVYVILKLIFFALCELSSLCKDLSMGFVTHLPSLYVSESLRLPCLMLYAVTAGA